MVSSNFIKHSNKKSTKLSVENKNNHKQSKLELINSLKNNSVKKESVVDVKVDDFKEDFKYKELYLKLKKELKERDKKNELAVNRLKQKHSDEIKSVVKNHKREIDNLKKKHHTEIDELENEILKLSNLVNDLNLTIIEYKNSEHELEMKKKEYLIEKNRYSNKSIAINENLSIIQKTNYTLKKAMERIPTQTEIQEMKEKIIKFEEYNAENWNTIKDLRDKIRIAENKAIAAEESKRSLELKLNPYQMISHLCEIIDSQNWRQFKDVKLLKDLYLFYRNKTFNINSIDFMLGVYVEESKIFKSVDDIEYTVASSTEPFNLKDGVPCKAYITEGNNVHINKIYKFIDEYNHDVEVLSNFRKSIKQKQLKEYEYVGDETIIFITGFNGNNIKNKFAKYGFNTKWINPFEGSRSQIESRIKDADVVVYFVDYISHEILDIGEIEGYKKIYARSFGEDILLDQIKEVINLKKS